MNPRAGRDKDSPAYDHNAGTLILHAGSFIKSRILSDLGAWAKSRGCSRQYNAWQRSQEEGG